MNTFVSAVLGTTFGVLGTATVFLMFHLWGYPYDKVTRKSAAPRSLMLLHRVLGVLFAILYVVMMANMVPRLFAYQVEFPPRTVAHICLGITIGFLLLIKLSILRFFRHLEEWMPALGTGILLCTYLSLGLSVPFAFRERALARSLGSGVGSMANLERIRRVLPDAGLPKEANLDELSTPKVLEEGRTVLLTKCVQCHDLRTVLLRPRSAKDWVRTVERMSERPVFGDSIDSRSQWRVATYLIAITPDLQQSAKKARAQKEEAKDARVVAVAAMEGPSEGDFDAEKVKPLFESKCSECHELSEIQEHVWSGPDDVKEVMERMVDNGLEATPEELDSLRRYLLATSGKGSVAAPPVPALAKETPTAPVAKHAAPPPKMPVAPKPPESGAAEAAAEAACGKKPLPDCPMQAWMKANAASASAGDDASTLASVLDRIAKMAPPDYGSWASIASEGAALARSGDIKGARTSCSNCHTQYRAKYKAEMRARPLR
jgi:cytochrome c553